MILIFYAFAREVGAFRRRIKPTLALGDPHLKGFRAQIGGIQIAAVATGMGFDRASAAARRAFDLFPDPEIVIGTGVAGALSSGLAAGDLVLADRIIARDHDATVRHVAVIADQNLAELGRFLRLARVEYSTGAILSSRLLLGTGAEKRAAKTLTGAIAVDMETAAIALEAERLGLRFAVMRAVMDAVDEDVIGGDIAGPDGKVRGRDAARFIASNPGVILRLPRMMRNLGRATRTLADALEAVVLRGETPRARLSGRRHSRRRSGAVSPDSQVNTGRSRS